MERKGTVLKVESLGSIQSKKDGLTYYPFALMIKYGVKTEETDVGMFPSLEESCDQYFRLGEECEYQIEHNAKETKKSKITPLIKSDSKPITEDKKPVKKPTNTQEGHKGVSDNFWLMQKLDALKYTVPYAKDKEVALINSGKYQEGGFDKIANEILNWWLSKIEEIKNS